MAFVPFVQRLRYQPPPPPPPPPPSRSILPLPKRPAPGEPPGWADPEARAAEDARRKRRREDIIDAYRAAREELIAIAPMNAQSIPETLPMPRINPDAPQPRVNSLVNIYIMREKAPLRIDRTRILACVPVVRFGRSSLRKHVIEASTPVHTHWSLQKTAGGPASAASSYAAYFHVAVVTAMAIVAKGESLWVRINERDDDDAVDYKNEVNKPLVPEGHVLDIDRLRRLLPTPPKALGPTISVQYPAAAPSKKRQRDAEAAGIAVAHAHNTVRATFFRNSASLLGHQSTLTRQMRAVYDGIVSAYAVRAEMDRGVAPAL